MEQNKQIRAVNPRHLSNTARLEVRKSGSPKDRKSERPKVRKTESPKDRKTERPKVRKTQNPEELPFFQEISSGLSVFLTYYALKCFLINGLTLGIQLYDRVTQFCNSCHDPGLVTY